MHHPQPRKILLATVLILAVGASACATGGEVGVTATGSVTVDPNDGRADGGPTRTGEPAPGANGRMGPRGDDATTTATGDATADGRPHASPPIPDTMPQTCPSGVVTTGTSLTVDFEHAEIPPTDGFAILTCEWRDPGGSIASIEVSFSAELFGSNLADVKGAKPVNVAGVDGYLIHTEDRKVTADMFQFHVDDVYVTGGSIEIDDIDQGDVLELAAVAVEAVRGG